MKNSYFYTGLLLGLFSLSVAGSYGQYLPKKPQTQPNLQQVNQQFAAQSLHFTENKGQVADLDGKLRPDILFTAQKEGVTLFLTANGIHYQFRRDFTKAKNALETPGIPGKPEMDEVDSSQFYRLDLTLKGANPNPKVVKEGAGVDVENFFLAHCPDGITGVRNYNRITYKEVYPNIDWVVYVKEGMLEYDFVVRPGGNVDEIKLQYTGAENLELDKLGALHIKTPLGKVTEQKPFSFQQEGKEVVSSFVLEGNMLGFEVPEYNESKALTIDPSIEWATYYGGSDEEWGNSCVADHSGNIYLAGYTGSASGIASGGYNNTYSGNYDAFLVKFNSAGVRQWATYYGGYDSDYGNGVAIDETGNVYLAGSTFSPEGIAFEGHQNTIGGDLDAFLVKFNSLGQRIWGTYYGGEDYEEQPSVATDKIGNVYLTGTTASRNGIASGGHQNSFAEGDGDAFLVKFNANGQRLWATYYGGSVGDGGKATAIDEMGNVFLTGYAYSLTGIASNGYKNTHDNEENGDGFLVKFNSDGQRQWGTYYGGSGDETCWSVALDVNGNVYITGYTHSAEGIASNGHQNNLSGGRDAFLVKFNTSGDRLWATYYGGNQYEDARSVVTNEDGKVIIAGFTNSAEGIALNGPQNTYAGENDAFIAVFSSSGQRLWASYYGGNNNELGFSLATNGFGILYLAGITTSLSNIAIGGHQNTYGGGRYDGFLVKISKLPNEQEDPYFSENNPDAMQSLLWSTYFGGEGDEIGHVLANDSKGNVYMVGQTSSGTGITKNAYQSQYGGGAYDGFIAKYAPDGILLWSTYYGGTGHDETRAIIIDKNDNIYVTGRTNSDGVIALNGHQNTRAGGFDGFLVKFNSDGQRLWGTYYGGSGDEILYDIDVDSEGNIYIGGETGSSTGIAYNGFQNSGSGAFLVKFNQNGQRIWGTYYNGATYCRSVEVDKDNNVYLSGMTGSSTGMAYNGHQNAIGGSFDGFLVKFNSLGQRIWATYYGGNAWDAVRDIATDSEGNVFISGETYSSNGIAYNGFQNTFAGSGGGSDAYLVKFNSAGVRQWATYYGGTGHEGQFRMGIDDLENIYFWGHGLSASGMIKNAFQKSNRGDYDPMIVKFSKTGHLIWSTYYGATEIEYLISGLFDRSGNFYVTGRTASRSKFTYRGYQFIHGGSEYDAFLVKFSEGAPTDTDGDGVPDASDCAPNDNAKYRTANLYIDKDNDGYDAGRENVCYGASIPSGYKTTTLGADCNDENNAITLARKWYKDADNDGYSDGAQLTQCTQPANYKLSTDLTATTGDCNDAKATVFPGAPEICDGLDNDCNGVGDEGAEVTWYKDADNDGYSDGTALTQCFKPANYKLAGNLMNTSGDCNDANAQIKPGASELCDGIDNNCNTQTDEGCPVGNTWYLDFDNDGYGNPAKKVQATTRPRGYIARDGDCRDWDPLSYPGAPETGDGIDNDCDGLVDEGLDCLKTWYYDGDGDGYGSDAYTRLSCKQHNGYVPLGGDCKNWDANVYPGRGCPPITGADGNAIQPKAMVETSADMQVFPNPARDEITVTLNGFEVGKKLELHMVQADGKVVSGQSLTPLTHSQQVRINVSRLSAGYYLLQVRQGALQQTKKVLIVK